MVKKLKELWIRFCLLRNRCPNCFCKMLHYNDLGQEYGYCSKCMDIAYYEDFTRVEFRD